jgi:starch phosphorylase
MNEGHSAFLALERMRHLIERRGLTFAEARELAGSGLVFTTHTPVEAGHDYFPPELMERYFASYHHALGLTRPEFLGLGRRNPADDREPFCPTVLALRLAAFSNGVSKLHGRVARTMWHGIWPNVPADEVPIGSVTNGVHFRSWISYEMNQLYDRYLGPQWREEGNGRLWQRAESIPAEELWRTHERRRERLVAFARRRLRAQLERRGAPQSEVESADEVLDPEALTIGFARRFATYKRATLVLRDPDRLLRILSNPDRPVQIIFAGKAHPRDEGGKQLIREVVSLARRKEFRRHLVFLEDYDMAVSRYLVEGVDVWLNTPLRPLEASGTSGMKAAANGALNVSTLDGWWDEAWRESGSNLIGWAIGRGEDYQDRNYQDQVEAEALCDLLENDVVPTFYDRGAGRLPRRWIVRMKASLSLLCHKFNTHRMVQQYAEEAYLPAHQRYAALDAADAARARALAAWLARVSSAWPQVRIEAVEDGNAPEMNAGETFTVRARVRLGTLAPGDVAVQVYHGRVDARGELLDPAVAPAAFSSRQDDGVSIYEAAVKLERGGGQYGFTVRVLPSHPDLASLRPGLVAWADAAAAHAAIP